MKPCKICDFFYNDQSQLTMRVTLCNHVLQLMVLGLCSRFVFPTVFFLSVLYMSFVRPCHIVRCVIKSILIGGFMANAASEFCKDVISSFNGLNLCLNRLLFSLSFKLMKDLHRLCLFSNVSFKAFFHLFSTILRAQLTWFAKVNG